MNKMKNILFTALMILLTLPAALFASWGRLGPGSCTWPGGGFIGGGLFMWIITLLLIIVIVVFAIKFFRSGSFPGVNNETPLDILKKRLSKGEITKKEFEELKKMI